MKRKTIIYFFVIFVILILFLYYQNNSIVITDYTYESNKISSSFNNFKILQISDLHNAEFGKNNKRLIKVINDVKPGVIFITGDLIDRDRTDLKIIDNLLKNIKFKTYYITGNHEYSSSVYEDLKAILNKYDVYILENTYKIISVKDENIELYGINDPSLVASTRNLSDKEIVDDEIVSVLEDNNNFKILLSHRPELLNEYSKYNFDLVFAGHAHGGQIRVPFIGGLYAPHQGVFPKYTKGKYTRNDTAMYVSRGLGNSVFPQRIFNRPEVVIVTFKKI